MLNWATGNSRKPLSPCFLQAGRLHRGFTLLEVLVVVFLIALTTSLAVATLGRDDQALVDRQARQLLEDLAFARDLALTQHRLVGWHPDAEGYQFSLRTSRGHWQAYQSRALPQRKWSQGVQLKELLHQEGERSSAERENGENREASGLAAPSLVFFPGGEITPARLRLQLNSSQRHLRLGAGQLEFLDLIHEN